jgi:hypothetical protein
MCPLLGSTVSTQRRARAVEFSVRLSKSTVVPHGRQRDGSVSGPFFSKNSATKNSKSLTSCGPIAIVVQYPDRVGLALRG